MADLSLKSSKIGNQQNLNFNKDLSKFKRSKSILIPKDLNSGGKLSLG